jgi:hypothetical protein
LSNASNTAKPASLRLCHHSQRPNGFVRTQFQEVGFVRAKPTVRPPEQPAKVPQFCVTLVILPQALGSIGNRLDILRRYSARGPEQARQAMEMIFGLENDFKALTGEYAGLKDPQILAKNPQILAKKGSDERQFRDAVKADPALASKYGGLWDTIADAAAKVRMRAVT